MVTGVCARSCVGRGRMRWLGVPGSVDRPGAIGNVSFGITPTRAPERYVSRSELADLMGVSLATVDRLVAEGMPSVTWGRRTRRFRPSIAIAWAIDRERAA
jgi:hypothetical protein